MESDRDIVKQLSILLSEKEQIDQVLLDDFFIYPGAIRSDDIKNLPAPNDKDYEILEESLLAFPEIREARKLLAYLEMHPSMQMVPTLFQLLGNEFLPKEIVQILEKTYHHKLENGASDWWKLWMADNENHQNVGSLG